MELSPELRRGKDDTVREENECAEDGECAPSPGAEQQWIEELERKIGQQLLELHRHGVSVSAIARQVGPDRKTVHKYIARGLEPPQYGPRPRRASKIAPFSRCLRERLAASPQLTGRRLHRELRELGYTGGYSILTDVRPTEPSPFEVRFETPPGRQAQVDFAHFRTVFTDEPGTSAEHEPDRLSMGQCGGGELHEDAEREEVDGRAYRDLAEVKASVGRFIEEVYNRQRLHPALAYMAPEAYEASLPPLALASHAAPMPAAAE